MRFTALIFVLTVAVSDGALEVPVNDIELRDPSPSYSSVAVASNGGSFVAVWDNATSSESQLFSTSLTAAGQPSGRMRAALTPPTEVAFHAASEIAIASNGIDYLAVSGVGGDIAAIRLDAAGRRLGPPINVHGPAGFLTHPSDPALALLSVAWDGDRYVIVAQMDDLTLVNGTSVHVLRMFATTVRASGEVDAREIPLREASKRSILAVAARNGVAVIASWQIGSGPIEIRTLSSGNAIGSTTAIATMTSHVDTVHTLTSAAGDDGFLIVWNDDGAIRARHLSPSGAPDAESMLLGLASPLAAVAATWHRGRFIVAWPGGTRSVSGSVVVTMPAAIPTDATHPGIASNGTTAVVTFLNGGVVGRRVDDFDTQTAHPLEIAVREQTAVSGAYHASMYGVAWQENENEMRFGRFTSSGARLDGQGIVVESHVILKASLLAVAASEESFLIVSLGLSSTLFVARVSRNGTLLDSNPLPLPLTHSESLQTLTVLAHGAGFVVLIAFRSGLIAIPIAGVGADPVGTPVVVSTDSTDAIASAWDGNGWLVAYRVDTGKLMAFRLSPALVARALPRPIAEGAAHALDVACDADCVAAWYEDVDPRFASTIHTRRIASDDQLSPPASVALTGIPRTRPFLIAVTEGYKLTWSDSGGQIRADVSSGAFEMFLSRDGTPRTLPQRVAIPIDFEPVTSMTGRLATVVYSRYVLDLAAYRTFLNSPIRARNVR